MPYPQRYRGLHLAMLLTLAGLTACSTVECPLNNSVYANYKLAGNVTTMADTMTISTRLQSGADSILINKQVNTDSFSLPVSYGQDEDVLYVYTGALKDTVRIQKTNRPHFESVDCGINYFHSLTGVSFTRHAIDSIVINQKEVTYDASQKHFYIYFKQYR